MTGISYEDFVDTSYRPDRSELVCTFYLEPAAGIDVEAAASRVGSESSNGTWTELDVEGGVTDLSATAFDIDGNEVRVAYPEALFEEGNMAQILSCIAGNILGMKAVDRIRLLDCEWPEPIVRGFPGPAFGTAVREEIFDAGDHPITATVPKPKVGLSTEAHARVGYEAWTGGIDLLKDDENLTDQAFNPFEDRLIMTILVSYRPSPPRGWRWPVNSENSHYQGEPRGARPRRGGDRRAKELPRERHRRDGGDAGPRRRGRRARRRVRHGGRGHRGVVALQSVRERCGRHGLAIHAHRAMHAAFDRVETHGVSMRCLAQFARLCGVDQSHTGTANLGKLENEDTVGINEWLRADRHGLNDVLPVASGGLHPELIPALMDEVGTDVCIQAGGGVHGHPDGTHAGARALRQAVDATMAGVPLEEYAADRPELAAALARWGTETPR